MANTRSARKMIRKIRERTERNRDRRSRMRRFVRRVEEAITGGDKTAAHAAFVAAQPEIARCAQKGIIHRRTAARKVSRLALRVQGMGK